MVFLKTAVRTITSSPKQGGTTKLVTPSVKDHHLRGLREELPNQLFQHLGKSHLEGLGFVDDLEASPIERCEFLPREPGEIHEGLV